MLLISKPTLPIPEIVSPPVPSAKEPYAEKPCAVFVDDHFHYINEDERYKDGDYTTLEEAASKCQAIVDEFLRDQLAPSASILMRSSWSASS